MALKGDFDGHPFRGNQWSRGGLGVASSFAATRNARTTSVSHLLNVAFQGDKELLAEFNSAIAAVDADVKAGKESFRSHVKNLKELDSGKAKRPAYTKARLKVHNEIINTILKNADSHLPKEGEKPEVIFLGGRGGSGKGGFNKAKGFESGVYSDQSHLLLDPDKVKSMMPEYDPEKAYLVHRESTHIFDKLVTVARRRGLNVVLDTTMRSSALPTVNRFIKSGYKTQAHFMHLSPEGAVVRAASRWANDREKLPDGTMSKRGRLVPPDVVLSMVNNEKNFDAVARKVDTSSVWANDRPYGEGPRLIPKKAKKMEGFSLVFKANPFHDSLGRFSDHASAKFVSSWGKSSVSGLEFSEGSKVISSWSGVLTHSTSAEAGKAIHKDGFKVSHGLLDDGVYMMEGGSSESSAASTETTVKAKVSKLRLLEVKDVASLSKFVNTNKASLKGNRLDEKLSSVGFDGIRVVKPYTEGAKVPWVVVFDPKKLKVIDGASVKKDGSGLLGFSLVLKANPYHDHLGRFTSHGKASSVSIWGKKSANIDSKTNNGKNALASQQHLGKVKELSYVLGTHVRGGGTLSDAFGKSVLNQAQLHASGAKAYGTHAISEVSDSYRGALDNAIANAFSKSGMSTKEKVAAGIPLTKEEEAAIAKSKEYDKKMYSKKMKAQKLEELPALFAASSATFIQHGMDSAEHKKAKAKLNKAILMAQKHGASDAEVADVALDAHQKKTSAANAASVDAVNTLFNATKKSALDDDPGHIDKVHEELSNKYAGVLSKDALSSSLVSATKAYNEAHQAARDKLSDAYSAYQPYKQDKKKGVTWDYLAGSLGVPKSQMKTAYDEYQAAYKHVYENYGELAATAAVEKGKELYAAKKATGATPFSEPVQLSAKEPPKSLGEVLTGKVKESPTPAKTTDAPSVSKSPMKKPATKEEAMDAAKALGAQYYLLKEGKYAGTNNPAAQPELAAAHSLYQQAKDHYVALGGSKDAFSSVSSSLKNDAVSKLSKAKAEAETVKNFHKQEVMDSAESLAQAVKNHKPGTKVLQAAYDKHAKVVKAASEHIGQGVIQTYEAAGKDKYAKALTMVKESATSSVQAAAAGLHAALLKHPKDKEHEDVLKAASHLDGVLKINSGVLSKEEITAAKSAGRQITAANHKSSLALADAFKNAPKVAASYDKKASSFKEVTYSQEFKDHGYAQVSKLSSTEKSVLSGYTGSDFTQTNRTVGAFGTAKMKGLPVSPLSNGLIHTMNAMDSIFSKTTLGADAKLRRNMPQKYFWEQLGFSIEQMNKMSDADLAALSGRVYKETAYSSTSTRGTFEGCFSQEAQKTGGLSLRIRASKDMPGIHAKSISKHSGEDEVVLPRGTSYVIRSIRRTPNSKFLYDVHVDMIGAFPDKL